MQVAVQIQFGVFFLTTARCMLQVPLYVNVRERGYYDDTDDTIKHYYDDEYYSIKDVKLGNPPRAYSLSLFNYEWRTAVFDRTFKQFKCRAIPGYKLRNITQRYEPGRSTTARVLYRNSRDLWVRPIVNLLCSAFDPMPDGYSYMVRDDVRVGSLLSKGTNFSVIAEVTGTLDNQWLEDGFIGLMRVGEVDGGTPVNKTESAIYKLAKDAGGTAEITLVHNRLNTTVVKPVVGGSLTLGGKDTSNCETEWTEIKEWEDEFGSKPIDQWNFGLKEFAVGSYSNSTPYFGVLSVGSADIQAPAQEFDAIVAATGAQVEKKGKYAVDCAKVPHLPPLNFVLTAARFTFNLVIEARDYIRNIYPRDDGKCTLQVSRLDMGECWVLGTSAAKSYCWSFNYETRKMSLARSFVNDFENFAKSTK